MAADDWWHAKNPTPEQIEAMLGYTKAHYGTAEVSESGIDISQLRRNRRMTPAQRLDSMLGALRFFDQVQRQNASRRGRKK